MKGEKKYFYGLVFSTAQILDVFYWYTQVVWVYFLFARHPLPICVLKFQIMLWLIQICACLIHLSQNNELFLIIVKRWPSASLTLINGTGYITIAICRSLFYWTPKEPAKIMAFHFLSALQYVLISSLIYF